MSAAIDILFEDEHILVVNKPPWVLSVPGRGPEKQDSMATRCQAYCGEIHVVHRLDCATSGVMIFAKTKVAEKLLHQQFRERETQKVYIAVGAGKACLEQGQVQLPLITDWPNRPKQKVDRESGKHSITEYQLIEQRADRARMKLYPITGRSHQLRVHMLYLGLPIIGDRLYAPDKIASASDRMLLHAERLVLHHPLSEDTLTLESPCPF
ncbi:MAG: pseudouridine synthase [Pseudomonadales bacterium]|nr:pseudouridine synthase [Pseudomonadales bacterium]